MSSIILMGIKHCGKSTQGKLIADYFDWPFFDTDDEIFKETGKSPREIYVEKGQEGFIEAEICACQKLVKNLLENNIDAVIATGGGICNNKKALEILHKIGIFVFMNSDEETAVKRIISEIEFSDDGKMQNLPAYIAKKFPKNEKDVKKIFHDFYVERQKIYKEICDKEVILEQKAEKLENRNKIIEVLKK